MTRKKPKRGIAQAVHCTCSHQSGIPTHSLKQSDATRVRTLPESEKGPWKNQKSKDHLPSRSTPLNLTIPPDCYIWLSMSKDSDKWILCTRREGVVAQISVSMEKARVMVARGNQGMSDTRSNRWQWETTGGSAWSTDMRWQGGKMTTEILSANLQKWQWHQSGIRNLSLEWTMKPIQGY